jgi:hypothetical protein
MPAFNQSISQAPEFVPTCDLNTNVDVFRHSRGGKVMNMFKDHVACKSPNHEKIYVELLCNVIDDLESRYSLRVNPA